MCGIVGYIGTCQAAPVLLDGLSKLEYRGYDSAGIAVYDGNKIQMQKAMGRLKVLEEMTQNGATLPGTVGIGHTRWATHGAPVSYTHLDVYKRQLEAHGIRVLKYPKQGFNYSAINNFGVKEAKGEYLLFLNNDMEIITPDFMEKMVSNLQRPQIGAVGAKLYYPDNTVQHAGIRCV